MPQRVPGSMRTRQSLSDLIEGRLSSPDGRAELVRLATRLIVEEALEAESRDAIGRDYYEHGAAPGQGYRNGSRTGRLKTAEGAIEYAAPQIAGRDDPFRSEIRDHLKGRTQALEDLAVELLARGLSVRDIEDAFKDESGRLLLSRTAVSELGERLWADYQEFATRDLGEYDIAYLFSVQLRVARAAPVTMRLSGRVHSPPATKFARCCPAVCPAYDKAPVIFGYYTVIPTSYDGGRYWTRTSDPCDVNTVLYQLS